MVWILFLLLLFLFVIILLMIGFLRRFRSIAKDCPQECETRVKPSHCKSARFLPGVLTPSKAWPFSASPQSTTKATQPTTSSASSILFPRVASDNVLQIFFGFGANYYYTPNELLTCNNDIAAMHTVWKTKIAQPYWTQREFILSDEPGISSSNRPTRQNWSTTVAQILQWANAQDAAGGVTEIVYMSSSHGFFQKTSNLDELDGVAECFVATDGFVWDYQIVDQFLSKLPASTHLLAMFDSCNSGSVMNLPWLYNRLSDSCQQDSRNLAFAASVWLISGCRDEQTSAAGRTTTDMSVLTAHLSKVLSNNLARSVSPTISITYLSLLASLASKNEFQIPILTTSHANLINVPLQSN